METAKSLAPALFEFAIRTALCLQSICKEKPTWFGMPVSPGTFMPGPTAGATAGVDVPWTFAHPAAVLPLRKIGRFHLPLAALVVGSIAPDLGYYIGQFRLATFAHSAPGIFLACIPTGALVLALFSRVRRALVRLLPHPHRHALAAASRISHRTTRRQDLVLAAAGLIAGAATHVVWDSFTHASGFAVQALPWLQAPVFAIGARQMHVYNVIQHASTFAGVVALWVAYRRWLRSQQLLPAPASAVLERMRYVVLAGCLAGACAIGGLAVAAQADPGSRSGPVDVFRMAILATDSLARLLLFSAWAWRKQGDA